MLLRLVLLKLCGFKGLVRLSRLIEEKAIFKLGSFTFGKSFSGGIRLFSIMLFSMFTLFSARDLFSPKCWSKASLFAQKSLPFSVNLVFCFSVPELIGSLVLMVVFKVFDIALEFISDNSNYLFYCFAQSCLFPVYRASVKSRLFYLKSINCSEFCFG